MKEKKSIWKKILRTIRWIFFAVIFFSMALLIIYYSSGYKINFKAKKIQKTGIILIDYKKNGIEIFIDGKKANYTKGRQGFWAPTNYLVSVLPGEYNIEIKKQGKINYSEIISVEEEKIARIEDFILIPENILEKNLFEENIVKYCISPNGKNLVYQLDSGSLYSYKVYNEEKISLPEKVRGIIPDSCQWNSENNKLIFQTDSNKNIEFYTFDFNEPNKSSFLHDTLSFVPPLKKIYFLPMDDNVLVGISDETLYKINIKNRSTEKKEIGVNELYLNNSIFYYKSGSKNLYILDQLFISSDIVIENLDINSDFEIVSSKSGLNYIKNGKTIYYVKDKNNLEIIDNDVEFLVKSNTEDGFFYSKNFEIWFYDFAKKEKEIISRFSQPIKKAEFYYKNNILHTSDKELGVVRESGKNNQKIKVETFIDSFSIIEKEKILLITKENEIYQFKIIDLEIE